MNEYIRGFHEARINNLGQIWNLTTNLPPYEETYPSSRQDQLLLCVKINNIDNVLDILLKTSRHIPVKELRKYNTNGGPVFCYLYKDDILFDSNDEEACKKNRIIEEQKFINLYNKLSKISI